MTEISKNEKTDTEMEKYRENLKHVVSLVLADEIPDGGIDVIFLHGRAVGDVGFDPKKRPGNDEGTLFGYLRQMYNRKKFRNVLIPGSDGQKFVPGTSPEDDYKGGKLRQTAWAGVSEYIRKLTEVGFDFVKDKIYTAGPKVRTTREENESVADKMKENGWESAALLAHPHQLLRALAGQIKEFENRDMKVRVYTCHPGLTNWDENVGGSQGQNLQPRSEHALPEMKRIITYTDKGDLATCDEILDYLKWRDGGLERLEGLLKTKMKNPNFQRDIEIM